MEKLESLKSVDLDLSYDKFTFIFTFVLPYRNHYLLKYCVFQIYLENMYMKS